MVRNDREEIGWYLEVPQSGLCPSRVVTRLWQGGYIWVLQPGKFVAIAAPPCYSVFRTKRTKWTHSGVANMGDKTCLFCDGSGKDRCSACEGKGKVGGFIGIGAKPCPVCEGVGESSCNHCSGKGKEL